MTVDIDSWADDLDELTRRIAELPDERRAIVIERAKLAARLRAEGFPMRQIAEAAGVSRQMLERQIAEFL